MLQTITTLTVGTQFNIYCVMPCPKIPGVRLGGVYDSQNCNIQKSTRVLFKTKLGNSFTFFDKNMGWYNIVSCEHSQAPMYF